MDTALRILHLNITADIETPLGGIETFLMNIYRGIDREKVQFDFISTAGTSYTVFRSEIEEMGGRIFELKVLGISLISRVKLFFKLRSFLLHSDYTIIHIHGTSPTWQTMINLAAKSAKIPVRIAHSHTAHSHNARNTSGLRGKIIRSFQPLLLRLATDYYACSVLAGEYLFGKNAASSGLVKLIRNGIDVSNFVFNEKIRAEYREKLKLEGKFVVGHVGRFVYPKNHIFLLKVFKEVHKANPNSCLMLIGIGELQNEIKQEARFLGLDKAVLFLDERTDANKLYQAMDVFVFPSHHEGLGIVAIEAQASGLRVIASDSIPREAKITNLLEFVALEKGFGKWAEVILAHEDEYTRVDMENVVREAGYSNKEVAQKLQSAYLEMRKAIEDREKMK